MTKIVDIRLFDEVSKQHLVDNTGKGDFNPDFTKNMFDMIRKSAIMNNRIEKLKIILEKIV